MKLIYKLVSNLLLVLFTSLRIYRDCSLRLRRVVVICSMEEDRSLYSFMNGGWWALMLRPNECYSFSK